MKDLNLTDLKEISGGSFAYDVGWAIRWLVYHGPGSNPALHAAWEAEQIALEAVQ